MNNFQEKQSLNMQRTALVIIDLQNGALKGAQLAPYTGEQVVANASRLAEAFTKNGAFVVLVGSTYGGKNMIQVKTEHKDHAQIVEE